MKRTAIGAVVGLILGFGSPAQAGNSSWNLVSDYSTASNPVGAWSFGWEAAGSLGGTFNLYDAVHYTQWYDPNHTSRDFTPSIWYNNSTSAPNGVAPGELSLHPGWDGSFSVVRWTAPREATVSVTGVFRTGDRGPMSDYILFDNAVVQQALSNGESMTFGFSRQVVAGDTLDFAVGVPIRGIYEFGNTPISVNISAQWADPPPPVPEPETLAMMMLGLGVIGAVARRKR